MTDASESPGRVCPPALQVLHIVVAFYGIPWKPYHGAQGGKTFRSIEAVYEWRDQARQMTPQVPVGLWPGNPHRIIDAVITPFGVDHGQVIAICVPI